MNLIFHVGSAKNTK